VPHYFRALLQVRHNGHREQAAIWVGPFADAARWSEIRTIAIRYASLTGATINVGGHAPFVTGRLL
jgi:hypothetical protein